MWKISEFWSERRVLVESHVDKLKFFVWKIKDKDLMIFEKQEKTCATLEGVALVKKDDPPK